MAKYQAVFIRNVTLSVLVEVEADDEDEALNLAEAKADAMGDDEFEDYGGDFKQFCDSIEIVKADDA